MGSNPRKRSRTLIEAEKKGASGVVQDLRDVGQEIAAEVMEAAREWVAQFTVTIGTTGMAQNSKEAKDLAPGSGVVIRQHGNTYGVLTAGHVLRRDGNTSNHTQVTLLTSSRYQDDDSLTLPHRPCTVVGMDNDTKEGPDIAIIPLESGEMGILDARGINAYNLDKERFLDKDIAKLGKNPWDLSIIYGVRCEASQIIHGHTDGSRGSLALVATNTTVDVAWEKDGYDYLELPSETTEYSYPTKWTETLPGTSEEEIEHLFHKGVTRQVWGGTSGAGVWKMAIESDQNGRPDGKVFGKLIGICFYACPDKGCIVANGTKSITKIAASHMEKEALRYHNLL